MNVLDILDFTKAFSRVNTDRRDDAFPDVVGYRDYKDHLEENIGLIKAKIVDITQYQTSLPLRIDLPKRGYTLRPGIVPYIDDRIIYQSIADLLSKYFKPEENVYSNKLASFDSDQMFVQGVELWVAFQNKVEEYCGQFQFVVETDVTAYFDHINHDLMLSRIQDIFKDNIEKDDLNGIKSILRKMWGSWNVGYLRNFGIPQINDPSSFMANLYLDELDKWLMSRNLVYLRYVDDIRIFTTSEPQARRALADLIVKMREIGLYIASGKTKIKSTDEVIRDLTNGRKQIRDIEDDIDSADPERMEKAADKLKDFFLNLVNDPLEFNDRLFRFCINRFKKLYVTRLGIDIQPKVIQEVISRLGTMPESTDVFIDYLSLFPDDLYIQESVIEFLESSYNIYPWQEMLLLELLLRTNLSTDLLRRAIYYSNYVIDSNKHSGCQAKAFILLGKNGSYATRRDVRSHYYLEERSIVKRSIIVAIQEMKSDERDNFYNRVTNDSRDIGQTVNYIRKMTKPSYFYYYPPSPYEVLPPDYDSDDLYDLGSEYFL